MDRMRATIDDLSSRLASAGKLQGLGLKKVFAFDSEPPSWQVSRRSLREPQQSLPDQISRKVRLG
jgi:hypothetical protein